MDEQIETQKLKGSLQEGLRHCLEEIRHPSKLSVYPVDVLAFLPGPNYILDTDGVPYHPTLAGYHPTSIAQYALARWNQYLRAGADEHRKAFLAQAYWLVANETPIGKDAGGWPVSFPHPDVLCGGAWLSALTQGNGISVLLRAYELSREQAFLEVAQRVVRTFERDILDGGVSTPIGADGVFFEEVAVYPATHMLTGFIFALFGLYDYVALTDDRGTKELIGRSLTTMHLLLDEFDLGFWTRADLLHRQLATPIQLALQIMLLEALANHSGCEHCLRLAAHWESYQHQWSSRLRYLVTSHYASLSNRLQNLMRSLLFPKPQRSHPLRICVPITAFPVTGGTRTVLAKIAQATSDIWQMEYLTHSVGPKAETFVIHRFGTRTMAPWQFPMVWLYCLAGLRKLISLLHRGTSYDVILPQDGVYTAAFSALVARLAGVRVVCIDHGNLSLLKSHVYRTERIQSLVTKHRTHQLIARLLLLCYWPSLSFLAWFATHFVDHYLIPGAAGDGVEDVLRPFGVGPSRITRFANVINIDRHIVPDAESRAEIREKNGIATNAIVITMICRLAPEKGLDIALEAISQALSALSPDQHARVRVIFAGDGPLRKQLEADIRTRKLHQTCMLWGEASEEMVISLLGLSDIFLFTSRRAAGYPLAILEAMASSCATIASNEPLANVQVLAEGRGITVPIGDAEQIARALVRLINDPELRHQMGTSARNYIAIKHSPILLRRVMIRTNYWSGLDKLLNNTCSELGLMIREIENLERGRNV